MVWVELTEGAMEDIRNPDGSVKAPVLKDLKKLEISPSDRGEALGSHNNSTGELTGPRKLYLGAEKA